MSAFRVVSDAEARPWLVLVHGMSQNDRLFDKQVDFFRASHRILLVDLPGHGRSSNISGPFGHAEFANFTSDIISKLNIEDLTLWGTHTGAAVGLILASQASAKIKALVLEGPVVPGSVPASVKKMNTIVRSAMADGDQRHAIKLWWEQSPWFRQIRKAPDVYRAEAHFDVIKDFEGRPWTDTAQPQTISGIEMSLSSITCPALIYNGAFDGDDFLTAAKSIHRLIQTSVCRTVPETGGFPAWERPEAVNRMVWEFLKQVS